MIEPSVSVTSSELWRRLRQEARIGFWRSVILRLPPWAKRWNFSWWIYTGNPMTFRQAWESLCWTYRHARGKFEVIKRDPGLVRSIQVAEDYLKTHPEAWEGIKKATYAYHNPNLPTAHVFYDKERTAPCELCGRTREDVRWDALPPQCAERKTVTITEVIAREEVRFDKVMVRAEKLAATLDVSTLTGEDLSTFHHTHGIDPSMLECALMEMGKSLPQHLHDEYGVAYAAHEATGKRGGVKREVVVAKTREDET